MGEEYYNCPSCEEEFEHEEIEEGHNVICPHCDRKIGMREGELIVLLAHQLHTGIDDFPIDDSDD